MRSFDRSCGCRSSGRASLSSRTRPRGLTRVRRSDGPSRACAARQGNPRQRECGRYHRSLSDPPGSELWNPRCPPPISRTVGEDAPASRDQQPRCDRHDLDSLLLANRGMCGLPRVRIHPSDISVHPALQELAACGANAAVRLKQALFGLNKYLRLAKRRDIEISQGVA